MAEEEQNKHRKQGRHYGFLIPAGLLIGLGAGLLTGYPGSGLLIGLGVGFLAVGLIPLGKRSREAEGPHPGDGNVTSILLGAFLVLVGIVIIWSPVALWPYFIAWLLIFIGFWFILRGFYRFP